MAKAVVTAAINGDASGFKRAINDAKQSVSTFGRGQLSSIAGMVAGAFSIGAIAAFTRSLMQSADAVVDVANGLGMSVKEVVALKRAGDEVGMSFERVQAFVQKLADAQQKALAGGAGSEMAQSFQQLGVEWSALAAMSPVELMKAFADATAQGGVSVAALNAVMGRGASVDFIDAFGGMANETLPAFIDRMGAASDAVQRLADAQQGLNSTTAKFKEIGMNALSYLIEAWADCAALVRKAMQGKGMIEAVRELEQEKATAAESRAGKDNAAGDAQAALNQQIADAAQSKTIQATLKEWRKEDAARAKKKEAARKAQDESTDPEWQSVVDELERKAGAKKELDAVMSGKGITTSGLAPATDQTRIGHLQGIQNDPAQRFLERQTEIQKEILRVIKESKITPSELREILEGN